MNIRAIVRFICCGLVFCSASLPAAAGDVTNANLVSNPSFESGVAGYWHSVWSGTARIRAVTSAAHTGSRGLEITGTNASATVWQNFAVPSHRAASVSLWVQPTGLSGSGTTGLEIKSSGRFHYLSPDQRTPDGQWRQISIDFNTGDATNLTVICAFEINGRGTGQVRFDDLSLAIDGTTVPSPLTLSTSNGPAGKPVFLLNGDPFMPVILTMNSHAPSLAELRQLRSSGVNCLFRTLQAREAADGSVGDFLRNCRDAGMPVIVEFWPSFWDGWLRAAPGRNLQFGTNHTGSKRFVEYFPDYLKPEVQAYATTEITNVVEALRPFEHSPVVAYCIGAYDGYHLPDGETHALWKVANHRTPDGQETWLPYGAQVTADFQAFLAGNSVSAAGIGFPTLASVTTPTSLSAAANPEHWRWWLRYRRFFVRRYVELVAGTFRNLCGLPVTGTLDLNAALLENWATPVTDYSAPFDFLFLYWTPRWTFAGNLPARDGVPVLLRVAQNELADRGMASLALMNFNTAIFPAEAPPNSLEEMDYSLPLVSGFFLWKEEHNAEFVNRAVALGTNVALTTGAPKARTAILVGESDVMNGEREFRGGWLLQRQGVPYDIVYRAADLPRYENLYLLPHQPALQANGEAQRAVREFTAGGGRVLGSLYELFDSPFTAFDFEESDALNASWIAGHGAGKLSVSREIGRARSGNAALRWQYSLPAAPAGNSPTFDLAIPDWNLSGLKKIGLWCYLDCPASKTGRVMAMDLVHYRSGRPPAALGDWNAGSEGLASGQWVWHEWTVSTNGDMTDVDFLRLRYDAGDDWRQIARDGTNVTIYLDDIEFFFDSANGSSR